MEHFQHRKELIGRLQEAAPRADVDLPLLVVVL